MIALRLQAVSHNTTRLIVAASTLLLWGESRERNMADDEGKEAKSAIRVNLANHSNALSDDATVFDDVIRACGAKCLITDK